MIRKFGILFFFSLFMGLHGFAFQPDSVFLSANDYYAHQYFDTAIVQYQSLIDSGYVNEEVYYNLGNAYYKTDQIPEAVYYYEKALQINPDNQDVLYNLKLANLKIADKTEPLKRSELGAWFYRILIRLDTHQWLMYGLACLWIALIFGAGFIFLRNKPMKRISFTIAVALLFGGFVFLGLGKYKNHLQHKFQYAIIFEPNVYVKSAPEKNGTDLFIIHEGLKVKVLEQYGEWANIQIGENKKGWVHTGDFKVI
jgi:tetratricopeptide (TPR) repeat protein